MYSEVLVVIDSCNNLYSSTSEKVYKVTKQMCSHVNNYRIYKCSFSYSFCRDENVKSKEKKSHFDR